MAGNRYSETDDLLKALGHRMRRAILREMNDEELFSPSEVAPRLEDSVSNVSYHFRMLDRGKMVELVEEKQVRGATQHFYRRTVKRPWARKLLEEPED
jgi:DNA-binding transcriptional ArsR family regulator